MRRLGSNFSVTVAVLLCAAIAWLWVRSYRQPEQLSRFFPRHYVEVNSYSGRIDLEWTTYPRPLPRQSWELTLRHEPISAAYRSPGTSLLNRIGFECDRFRGGSYTMYVLIVPWWAVLLLAGSSAATWHLHRSRDKRRRARFLSNLCIRCGYDLRATPGRCPECGMAATSEATL